MKKSLFLLLLTLCVLSCVKAQSLGAGVSIDAQGNLKIDAPLYVIDKNQKKPGLKPAPSTMNSKVIAGIYMGGDIDYSLEITGGIVKGRLSITIKKPEKVFSDNAATLLNIPAELFTSGADVQFGEIILRMKNEADEPVDYPSIMLYSNYQVKLSTVTERETYYIDGDCYSFTYSLGDVDISYRFNAPPGDMAWYREYDNILNKAGMLYVMEIILMIRLKIM